MIIKLNKVNEMYAIDRGSNYVCSMGWWLHSANPSEPNPDQSKPRWNVSKQYNGQSHALALDDIHNVNPSWIVAG